MYSRFLLVLYFQNIAVERGSPLRRSSSKAVVVFLRSAINLGASFFCKMMTTAFSPSVPLVLKGSHVQQVCRRQTLRRPRTFNFVCCERPPSAVATPVVEETEPSGPRVPQEAVSVAQAILDDVADRPQYYLNVSGVLVGLMLSIVVLSATTFALDRLPLVPDALRMIGLGYIFWFLGKFLLNGGERQRLEEEIDEFVDIVRGDLPGPGGVFAVAQGEEAKLVEGSVERADADLVV